MGNWQRMKEQAEGQRDAKEKEKALKETKKALRKELKDSEFMRRTCRECGHEWVIPVALRSIGKMAGLGGDSVIGAASIQFETCVRCGSVRYFAEQAEPGPS